MDISVQTLAVPQQPLQAPQALFPLASVPQISSGVGAYSEGLNQGNTIAAPLDRGISQIGETFSPQGQADIARARLAKTSFDQENSAAQQTPDLPLGQRRLAGAQIDSALTKLPSQTQLGVAENQGRLAVIPSLTAQQIASSGAATQAAENEIATTPTFKPADQPMLDTDIQHNAQAQANALEAAKNRSQIMRAGFGDINGDGSGGPGGSGIHYYPTFENGKINYKPEATQMIQQQGDGGSYHNVLVGKNTGTVYKDFGTGIQQARMDQTRNLAGARYGVGADSDNPVISGIAKAQEQADPNLSNKAGQQAMKVQGEWNSTINKLYRPKVQLLQGFQSVAKQALDPNSTGVPDVDLIDTAGRIYKGGQMTETQYHAIQNASGIFDRLRNLPAGVTNGKILTPAQRHDLIQSINSFTDELQTSFEGDYDNMIKQLPTGAEPERYLGSRSLLQTDEGQGKENSGEKAYTTPQAHQQAIEWANAHPDDPRSAAILQTAQQNLNGQY